MVPEQPFPPHLRLVGREDAWTIASALAGADGSLELEDLSLTMAARAPGVDSDRMAIRLHHVILPRLSRANILTYDADTRRIYPEPNLERFVAISDRLHP